MPAQGGDPLLEPWRAELDALESPWPAGPVALEGDPFDLPPPLPPSLVAGRLAEPGSRLRPADDDTVPLALVPFPRPPEDVRYSLETPPRGLRKFDLGTVPASVTPPATWRKAALFAVLTSAAVVCALTVAAIRFVGGPSSRGGIESLPGFPTRPLELEELPAHSSSGIGGGSGGSSRASSTSGTSTGGGATSQEKEAAPSAATPTVSVTVTGTSTTSRPATASSTTPPHATPSRPERITVGPSPVTPTDPKAMGDRTEQYFSLVTANPYAAYQLCTGELANSGPDAILARYSDVTDIQVLHITINRGQAVTLNVLRLVHADGSVTMEVRQLTFTRGLDPRISDDTITA
ncbi:hypothetical protein [Actinophytocola xanthii]|uniref:Uncharacterized protein n=1 Tax=Actinophytocola xanthii TaxID=1912961 RepID=A0A1Q8CDJ6_9PSEU|nr:hypothetical protein [Actinophytocola xanthii]OLF12448.1 hypothetical protein BU204_29120 [Actinophytocola xanthii]